jgi:hypothetical protein
VETLTGFTDLSGRVGDFCGLSRAKPTLLGQVSRKISQGDIKATRRNVSRIQHSNRTPRGSFVFMRFAVLCKGILRGMGREVGCELLATKTVLPEASDPVYSHCAVIDAPRDLADGEYEVEFAGEVAVVTLRGGSWVVGRILPHTYSEAATFYAEENARTDAQTSAVEQRKAGRNPRDMSRPTGA